MAFWFRFTAESPFSLLFIRKTEDVGTASLEYGSKKSLLMNHLHYATELSLES